jgi:hypothetical protein
VAVLVSVSIRLARGKEVPFIRPAEIDKVTPLISRLPLASCGFKVRKINCP